MVVGAIAMAAALSSPVAAVAAISAGPPSAAAMATAIHESRGCLGVLSQSDRRLLVLRFGIGGRSHESDQAVATSLGLTVAAVVASETQAVDTLARACGVSPPPLGVAASAPSLSTPAPVAVPRGSGGGLAIDEALAIAVIAACVVVAAHEFRKALFSPRPRA